MSIEKFNPKISGELVPYTMINTHVIQNITNIDAGFVWVYLLTLPKDWQVAKSHIKKHFKIGDDKLKGIFSYLNKHGLIEYVRNRTPDGKLRKTEIRILNGSRFTTDLSTTGVKNHPVENHTCGKPGTTKNISITKKIYKQNIDSSPKKITLKKSKQETPIPPDFVHDETHLSLSKSLNLDLKYQLELFKDHALSNDRRCKDWNAAFRNWLRKSNEFKPVEKQHNNVTYLNKMNKTNEIRSTVKEWGPGHPSYDSLHGVKK